MIEQCKRCGSTRIAEVSAKCSDLCSFKVGTRRIDYYVPEGVGLGNNSDCVEVSYCIDCGQIVGDWPVLQQDVDNAFSVGGK